MSDKYTINLPIFDECLSSSGRYEVNTSSPKETKEALEKFARYFKYEFNFDDVQYHAENHDKNCIGFLFTESAFDMATDDNPQTPTRCVGGCCFRKEEFKGSIKWVLYWVWFHPYFRNKGILSSHWSPFTEQFGDFIVWPPLSPAMESFIDKQKI